MTVVMDVRRDRAQSGIARCIHAWRDLAANDRRPVSFLTQADRHDRSPSLGEGTAIRAAMRRAGASLFHATYPYLLVPRNVPTLLTLYDTLQLDRRRPHRDVARAMLGRNVARSRAIVTISEHSRREVCERLRVAESKVHVVTLGFDPAPGAGDDDVPPAPYLLYVGNTKAHKHVEELVQWSGAELPRRGLRLVAVVPEAEHARLQALGGSLVELRANVDDRELADLRRRALGSVSLAEGEGFGLPPLEAAAHGIPALLNDSGAHREVMADAAVYCTLDRESYAAAVDELIRRRAELAPAARRRAAHFSWEASWAQLAALYDVLA